MIIYKTGNLLKDDAQALINTVNTVGVMGKGIALQFKKAFPKNFQVYKRACDNKLLTTGEVLTVPTDNLTGSEYIINFPTKQHWREQSKLSYIQQGLIALLNEIDKNNIKSVAVPPLGCGNGGLDWNIVKPLLESVLQARPDVEWRIYEPNFQPKTQDIPINTVRPNMTEMRALLITLMDRYSVYNGIYEITSLEIQKMLYFLNAVGESMNGLKFEKNHYGPYSDAIRHVLNTLDGFYISGFNDASNLGPNLPLELMPNSIDVAKEWLNKNSTPTTKARLEYVSDLIKNYETPYGMELLSTVHWVVTQELAEAANNPELAVEHIHNWNNHKKNMSDKHILQAWKILKTKGWFNKTATSLN